VSGAISWVTVGLEVGPARRKALLRKRLSGAKRWPGSGTAGILIAAVVASLRDGTVVDASISILDREWGQGQVYIVALALAPLVFRRAKRKETETDAPLSRFIPPGTCRCQA